MKNIEDTFLESYANPEQFWYGFLHGFTAPVTEQERHQLLIEWNQTQTDYPQDKCIHQLFEEQVEKTPDAIAVVFVDAQSATSHSRSVSDRRRVNQQLTYQELNKKANKVANYLQSLGVQSEVLVGICVERSLEMVIGILGILKAGGAYVPLDIAYPQDRLAFMLSDSQVSILLTQQHLVEKLPEHQASIVCLDTDWEDIVKTPSQPTKIAVKPSNLAYIIYTSGSTGQPKGVLISHCNVARLFAATQPWFQFSQNDVWSLFHSYAFDFSVWEIWGALLYGGRLVIVPYYVSRSPKLFYELLSQERITVLNQTPSAFQQLIQFEASLSNNSNSSSNLNLRFVIFGGEALNIQSLKPWFDRHGDKFPQLVNMYGITETTVHVTYRPINIADLNSSSQVIGCAIPDLQFYILDSYLQPVPVGVAGEIYVGGAGLARGYLNRPELTAQRFISHPFNNQPEARLYKTGDLARYLPNGDIEYLGRIDNQVKIRGFRIELGEIETLLNQHPNLREAKVIAREDIPGDKRLVAYIIPNVKGEFNSLQSESYQIRDYLKQQLPDHMIPAAFVVLESFPLTNNGKVDYRALPAPNYTSARSNYVAPQNPTEKIIADIWSQVLKVDNIGIDDNFFELGGHSLLATQVLSRIRQTFNQEIPIHFLFEFPTILQFSKHLDIIETDNDLLIPVIQPRQQLKNLPLSFAQQRLWFLDQLQPDSTAYNLVRSFKIQGLLNIDALEKSIADIIERHELLRTNFVDINGQAMQIINNDCDNDFSLPVINLQSLSDDKREIEALKIVKQEVERPFNLVEDLLFRVQLLQLSTEKYLLVFNIHHIIFDGWSFGVLFAELKAIYTAYCEGLTSPLTKLPIQYADFTLWQRKWLTATILELQFNYWKQQLSGILPILELPTDRLRPRVQTYNGAAKSFVLSSELTAKITSFAQKEGVTLFMTLLTAFKVLLCRYSGQEDVIVGTPIAGRNRREIEGLMGFFVNTLALRTDLSEHPSFRELLRRVRRVCLEAYTHQDVPFEQLVELQPERDLSHTPIFQVMFALQNAPMGELQLPHLSVEVLEPLVKTAKFDITLSMEERNGQLIGEWEYNTDLFDDSTIEQILKNFQVLLSGILVDSEQNIWELPLLTEEEKHQLLVAWNQNEVNFNNDKCIHQLFEEQVRKTPDAIAVVYQDQYLAYKELNARVNQLARYLQTLGVGAEVLVGIYLERSLEMAIAMLGILKAGGAYLPLDPSYPQDRLEFMLFDATVPVLITMSALKESLPNHTAQVICLDSLQQAIAQQSPENPIDQTYPHNLAYIIYTSGSTGKPKGIMIEQRSLVNAYLAWEDAYYLSSQTTSHLQMASFSFDVFSGDLVRALCSGAKLVLSPRDFLLDAQQLYRLMCQEKVDCAEFVPAVLRNLIEYLEQTNQNLDFMKLLVVGSDSWYLSEYKHIQSLCGSQTRLINSYGVSEATIDSCYFEKEVVDLSVDRLTPIGHPFANNQIYILDANMQPVPIGVSGELYIGGDGLARGYLNRPDLTKEKFIPNSFSNKTGERLYRTGDLARYLPDGNIEFLGRIDNQVKIRGFRIELGEIETALAQHPQVQEVVVIVRQGNLGNKRLIAYITSNLLSDSLRDYLKQKLPDYMMPSAFVLMKALPMTPNGKVDRRALPVPDNSQIELEDNFVAPTTTTEKTLAAIWTEVLELQQIGINDNFFTLGGHSLIAIQVISRLRKAFDQEIPLSLLFEYPTISQLSLAIGITETNNSLLLPPIEPRQQQENLPLSFAQQRLWFFAQLEPNSTAYNMPFKLRLQGVLNITALERSIGEIVQRHEILRTNFISKDGEPTQVITKNIDFKLPIIDLQFLPDEQREIEAEKIAKKEAAIPVNLANDFLFRVKVLRLDAELHLLLFNIHHIIFDGWSDDILQRELTALYQAFSIGNPLQLPSPSIQYADFALYQHHWFTDEFLESQLVYWKQQLSGVLPVLELPMDSPRPQVQSYQGASHTLLLSSELTANIKNLCQKEGVTLFMTLLAAFKVLLSRYSGQEDIIVGTPIAGRNRTEIENLIGFFVNTLALRSDLSGNPSFRELLNRVRQVTLDAYAHQDLPFQKLVEQLKLVKNVSYNPVFQVWFNMTNLAQDSLKLNDLTVEPTSILETTSKFDLSLYVGEENNQIHLRFVYNTVLFDADTIKWMGTHFQKLLEGISTHPEKTISSFSILTQTERYELSHQPHQVSPTNSFIEFSKQEIEQSISSRFEQQVTKYPHHIAVKTQNYQWTYKELNTQAWRIAQALLEENNEQESKIALLFDHDAPMIAAMLGVLKAGKIYIPLDPKYPQDRVLYILEDSLAQVVLTNHKNLSYAQELVQGKLPVINIDDIKINDLLVEINQEISPDTLAYILYTSGSTGKPKGVIQNHRNVLHFIRNYTNNLRVSSEDKLSLFASYSFDAAIIDILSALLNGATLYPFDIKSEGLAHLVDWLEVEKITIYHSTPTVYRHFLEILNSKESIIKKQFSQVRLVVLGGEQVIKNDVELYQKFFADECVFVNGLGSTESSFNLQYLIDKSTKITQKYVPAGYAFEDTEIILLNHEGKQTDIYGEIAIISPYISLGYWQKPELTKAAFLEDPQGGNKRIYRTGDLGRLRANGVIECLGRKDFQVKIRGFRIELGEIETLLNQHPQIKETVVIAREDMFGEKRLVAYIIPKGGEAIINEIKQYLEQKLPDYMLPAAFVVLDVMPLTPNGKINRLALPTPDFNKLKSAEYTAPSNDLELQLTKIWENVLGVHPLGLNDNFFDVGGHSLLAIKLVTQIEIILGKNITPNTFFQAPTIKKLANILRQEEFSTSSSSLVPIQPHGSKRPFFYIHTIYGSLIYSLNLLSKLDADQPVYGLQAKGLDGIESPHTCVEDMASHYIKEIKTVQPHGPYFLGGWCAGGVIAYEMAQQLYTQGETVELLTIFDAYPPKMIPSTNKAANSVSLIKIKSSRIHQFVLSLKDMIKRSRSSFANLTLQQQIKSILEKINHRIQNRIKENVYQFYVRRNLPLPRAFLNLAVRDAIATAYKNYYPTVYPGKVIFFRAVEQTQEYTRYLERWEELAAGGLEIHDIPGHHDSIMSEPHVRVLAEKLKVCIERSTRNY